MYVHGPRLSRVTTTLACASALVGFRFRPGAAAKWLGADAGSIVDADLPLNAFGRRRAGDLTRAVGSAIEASTLAARLEASLVATLSDATVLDRQCIGKVLELLEREHRNGAFLNSLRRAYGLSERSVRRETIRIFGYGPKTLERIFRVQRFLWLARSPRPVPLAWLASAGGFSDQAHLTREVRALAGITPGEAVRFVQDAGAKLA